MSDTGKAVFLSYASQDAEAAKRICDALRTAGVEVWFDQNELVGGDAWDAKIRGQVKACALFVPIISAATQARLEGYFRLEWKLAAQRTHTMADAKPFLLPIVIDATRDAEAHVPEEFRAVQWTRLPGGNTPEKFCERVKKLLGGENVSQGSSLPAVGASLDDARGRGRAAPLQKPSRPWLVPAILGAAAIAAVALWRPWKNSAATPLAVAANATAAPVSEARKLTLQARALIDDDFMAVRENFRLADELCQRATALDPGEGEAWATWARVSSRMISNAYDRSEPRRAAARSQMERAIRLAPDSIEAGLAVATSVVQPPEQAERVRRLRDLLRRAPNDARIAYELVNDPDEAESAKRLIEFQSLLAHDPRPLVRQAVALRDQRRLREADALLDRAQAIAPTVGAYRVKLHLLIYLAEDLAGAKAYAEKLPVQLLTEDAIANHVAQLWLQLGEGEKALQALQRVPRDFFEETMAFIPKGFHEGWALRIAHRPTAAEAAWKTALDVVDRRLATAPNQPQLVRSKALLQALTGQAESAERNWKLYSELPDPSASKVSRNRSELDLALGRPEDAIRGLVQLWSEPGLKYFDSWLLPQIRFDPWFEPIRQDPRVQKIIAEGLVQLRAAWQTTGNSAGDTTGLAAKPDQKSASAEKSVAVLAFANLSDDKTNEYFSDGISEELLNVLAKVPGLKVSARTSAFYFKGKEVPIPEIAKQLGVAYVVEGSVRKQGDKVRITAQLIKAADGFHVWSDTFTRDLKDIFVVQDEIAGLIAQQLQLKLGESTRVTKVVNPEAYRLLLEGRQFWNLRTEEGFTKAETAFTKALTIDPQFAEAHAGLAGVYVIRSVYRELDGIAIDANDLQRADSEGRRALEIDPSSAEAHAALGHVDYFANRLGDSDRHFQQALTLSPNSALVHSWYATLLSAQGRLDASLQHYQMAAELDPLWFINLHMLGSELALAQRFDQSLGIIERAAALRTEIFLHNTAGRACALLALGRKEDAFEAARYILRHPDVRPRWNSDAVAIRVLWEGGRQQEAEYEAARLLTRWPQDFYLRGFTLVALGRFDEALPYLTRTPSSLVRTLYWEPMWDLWREDPRFKQLIVKLGRAEEYKLARQTLARMLKEQEAKK